MIANNLNFKCCYFFVLSKSGPVIHSNNKCRSPVWMILKRTCKINEVFTTVTTRRSENDNTYQALNLSTNSPSMSRQAGNCKSFTSTHYLADWFIYPAPWQVNPILHSSSYPTHIPFIPRESTLLFLRYNKFKILPWKSKVKVMVEIKVERHQLSVISYWLTPLLVHVNRPFHSWDTKCSKFDIENLRWRWN